MRPKKTVLTRIDDFLIQQHLASNLKDAQALVMTGKVLVNSQIIDKPGCLVDPKHEIRIKGQRKFVSRGGNKLHELIQDLDLKDSFRNKTILDIGASTGGFTHCVLTYGAKQVVAVDVGTNQLDWSLRSHPQVVSYEKTDIRKFENETSLHFDWIVADVSFNSLQNLSSAIAALGGPDTQYILLVKPQFELAPNLVPNGGVILDDHLMDEAIKKAIHGFETLGLKLKTSYRPKTKGRKGNQEIFIYLKKDIPY